MKPANSQSIKLLNTNLVIDQLVELHETSRVELARLTTLNKATISSIIEDLVGKGIVIETAKSIRTSGRSANVIALNKNAGRILSIELLTNSIYGIIANLCGEILYEIKMVVDCPEFEPYLKVLLSTIDDLIKNTHDSIYGVIGIGIGVYGVLTKNKKIKYATFNSWKDIDLKQIIEEYTNIDTYVENEANISALGETMVHRNLDNLIALNIGLGVGMGVIINNELYTGENGFAGEIGHTILIPNGKHCVCGNHGCLERYICDTAIEERYYELSGEKITIQDYIKKYQNKNPFAEQIYQEFIEYLTITINNIAHTFNPKIIVINSKIIDAVPESISQIKNHLRSQIMALDVLTTSELKSKKNVLGLTHVLIQNFLNIKNFTNN